MHGDYRNYGLYSVNNLSKGWPNVDAIKISSKKILLIMM